MKTAHHLLKEKFTRAIKTAFPQLAAAEDIAAEITQSTNEKFGHYQFNSAMKLTKLLGMPPRQIAEKVIAALDSNALIQKVEIAGPGFVNITLNAAYVSDAVQQLLDDPHLAIEKPVHKQRIVIDFSSPNIAKELHVGHLRSTIIGDCLARLFEFLGNDVLRLNHIGDWGTQFGMLIAYMKEEVPEVLTGKHHTDLQHLVEWYKASKARFDADSAFKLRAQNEVSALQGGNEDSLKAWHILCDISREAYQEIYALLDIDINDRGESFYNPLLAGVIDDLTQKQMITLSDGAKCVFLEGFQNREGEPLPMIVQKSDGGYNYASTDMAAMKQRCQVEKADRIIIVTDAGQSTHFQMLAKAAEKAGYLDPAKVRFDHVTFGLVLGADGKKFKTRSGDTEKLIDLITAAIDRAKEIIAERSPEMDPKEQEELAKALGLGAIKYADLSCNRVGDYTFSYDRMLRFEGNTAAFLMYSYVRVAGIKRRINADIDAIRKKGTKISLEHPAEIALGMHLIQFGEMLDVLTNDLMPNHLTDYMYGLAEKFNAFFRDCHVEGTPEQDSRLLLCEAVAKTLHQGFEILGIHTVTRM